MRPEPDPSSAFAQIHTARLYSLGVTALVAGVSLMCANLIILGGLPTA